jgi:SRSO17 transposase
MMREVVVTGASIEATLELWASSLREVKARMRPLFSQARVAASANSFLDGLLGDERRKTGWMRAEAAGDAGPWRQQAILGRGRWDADALRDIVRDYAVEHLGTDDAVLVIDETGFLKQGKASCGVGRQYTGSAGKVTNCQIGVFAAYVSTRGHAFVDRALYLPKSWTADPARLAAAHVPEGTAFAAKPALAVQMIERAIAADMPFAWVAADAVYGVGDDLAFFTTWCPAGTTIETLVGVEGHRWVIEDSFETAKNELGLDHNETRSWHGWHRHVSLVMLAFAMLAAIRTRANATPPKRPWTIPRG